jgi:hypothetical protein
LWLNLVFSASFAQVRIQGIVKDADTGQPLQFSHVGIAGENLGTVTNRLGAFSLRIPESYVSESLVITFVGYRTVTRSISTIPQDSVIEVILAPTVRELNEIVISANHKSVVEEAIEKIPENYDLEAMLLTGFYRAQIDNRDLPIQLSETALEIFRIPEKKTTETKVRIVKGRVSRDTITFNKLFNVQAGIGPKALIQGSFLTENRIIGRKFLKTHSFKITDITTFDTYDVYVVEFDTDTKTGYRGTMFIDTKTLAFIRISYQYSDKQVENPRLFPGTNVASRLVGLSNSYWNNIHTELNFHELNGKWYIRHIQYNAGWTLVSGRNNLEEPMTYHADFIITDIKKSNLTLPSNNEFANKNIIENQLNTDTEDFWADYNYLLPDQDFDKLFDEIKQRNNTKP